MTREAAIVRLAGTLFIVSAALFCGGCDRAEPTVKPPPPHHPAKQRIVCMSPAMTQMILDMGGGDRIVGVGAFDFVAPKHAAVVGHLRGFDYEKLLAARPTDIVLQITREGVPDRLAELAAEQGWRIWRWRLEDRASVARTLVDPDAGDDQDANDSIGGLLGDVAAARALADSIERRLRAIAKLTAGRAKPRVLVVVGGDPMVMAAAPGTYIDELLVIAGGVNALTDSAVLYPELDAERLLSLAPDVVLDIPPRPRSENSPNPLGLPAGLSARVVTLADNRALLPSSSMPDVAAAMAMLLHPELADEIDAAMSGSPGAAHD